MASPELLAMHSALPVAKASFALHKLKKVN
jgi:hypothetical protein